MIVLARTYAVAAVGVAAFHLAGLPLPWLLGPIFACLIAGLAGLRMRGNKLVNALMRTVLGVAVGATLTAGVLASMPAMWPTLLMMPVLIVLAGAIGVPYFRRLWGFDFPTAYYAAMPGGLQDMLAFGEEAGGNLRSLSLIQTTRVLAIVATLPFLLHHFWGIDLTNPPGAPASQIAPGQLALMAVAGVAGWRIAAWLGLFGASILGPMLLAGLMAATGLLQHRPPAEAIAAAQFFIGMTVGSAYAGITLAELRRDVAAGLGYCVILLALAAMLTEAALLLGLAPPLETLLAFAPGGQAEMTILALISGADLAFVIAHHVLRIVVIIVGAPIAARFLDDGRRGGRQGGRRGGRGGGPGGGSGLP